jgi:hypothetical protein
MSRDRDRYDGRELRLLAAAARDLDGLRARNGSLPEMGIPTYEGRRPPVEVLKRFASSPVGVTTDLVTELFNGQSKAFWEAHDKAKGASFETELERFAERKAIRDADGLGEGAKLLAAYGIVPASTIAEEVAEWDWTGYLLRGALNLVEGNPEVGKTLLVLSVVASLSAGRPIPHGPANPRHRRRVLYLTAEDSISKTIVGRLRAAGANLDHVLVQKERGADLYFAGGDVEELRQIVRGEEISAIALDPLNAYLNGIDVNKEQEVRSALRPMRDFAEDENTSIIGLRHLNKATDKPALYRGGGSIALAAVARSVLLVARHPDEHGLRVLLSQKCNLIEEEKRPPLGFRIVKDDQGRPRIEWLADSIDIDAETLLAPQKPGPKPDTLEKAKGYLQDHLRAGPKPRGVLLESGAKVGLSERSLERAAKALGVQSEPQGRERVWSL